MSIEPAIESSGRIDRPPKVAKIFHSLWKELHDLGEIQAVFEIRCPLCLRPKSMEQLTLEHIIPQSALAHDPKWLRRAHNLDSRAGLTLLCKNCNRLKGRVYDPKIVTMFRFPALRIHEKRTNLTLKAHLILAYLGAFRELGYAYIRSSDLDAVRKNLLTPSAPYPIDDGNLFVRMIYDKPYDYFDGWCDKFDDAGNRIYSVFSCERRPHDNTLLVRTRHLLMTLPLGDSIILRNRR